MNKELLVKLVQKRMTIRQIAVECKTSSTNINYWLKKFGLRTRRGPHGSINGKFRAELEKLFPRKCGDCGTTEVSEFYGRRRDYCGKCFNKRKLIAGHNRRLWAIERLGGKCIVCGFNKIKSALDMHHKNSDKKDVGFKGFRYWSEERCEKEIIRCVLVCKNCHAGIHSGEVIIDFK